MKDYSRMTKAELIRRLQTLEQRQAGENSSPTNQVSDDEVRLRSIFETAVEGIVIINEQSLIDSINPSALRMFGYRSTELVGRNVNCLMPSPYREEHDRFIQNYLETGEAKIIGIGRQVKGRRKDGSVFPIDLGVNEVRLADRRLFAGFIRDLTEREQAERKLSDLAQTLAEKNKELETIMYVASHDLRSPLVNIHGFSQELALACEQVRNGLGALDGPRLPENLQLLLAEEIPEALEYIQAGVRKIDRLLSGFLRFSRLGRQALRPERLDMEVLLAEIGKAMEFQLKQAGATLKLQPIPEAWGDSLQVGQVFSNLLDNALKYRDPRRPGRIVVSGRVERGESVYQVEDNGIGIRREHQAKIFEMFHRLDPGRTEGEGLGLAITQRILERQEGRIWVESKPNEGSSFFVALPNPPPMQDKQGCDARSGHPDRRR